MRTSCRSVYSTPIEPIPSRRADDRAFLSESHGTVRLSTGSPSKANTARRAAGTEFRSEIDQQRAGLGARRRSQRRRTLKRAARSNRGRSLSNLPGD